MICVLKFLADLALVRKEVEIHAIGYSFLVGFHPTPSISFVCKIYVLASFQFAQTSLTIFRNFWSNFCWSFHPTMYAVRLYKWCLNFVLLLIHATFYFSSEVWDFGDAWSKSFKSSKICSLRRLCRSPQARNLTVGQDLIFHLTNSRSRRWQWLCSSVDDESTSPKMVTLIPLIFSSAVNPTS